MTTSLEPEAVPPGSQPEAVPPGSQLDRMIVGCIDKLVEAGYTVSGEFSASSYNYVFYAQKGKAQHSFRLTVEEQKNRNFDGFFKWGAELLRTAQVNGYKVP